MKENAIERYLILRVQEIGGQCVKFPPLFYAGFPDRLLFLPGGDLVMVETKAPGKAPGRLQAVVHERFRKLGFRVEIIDSIQAVDSLILSL